MYKNTVGMDSAVFGTCTCKNHVEKLTPLHLDKSYPPESNPTDRIVAIDRTSPLCKERKGFYD
jgi:hypothetical protein